MQYGVHQNECEPIAARSVTIAFVEYEKRNGGQEKSNQCARIASIDRHQHYLNNYHSKQNREARLTLALEKPLLIARLVRGCPCLSGCRPVRKTRPRQHQGKEQRDKVECRKHGISQSQA